MNNPMNITIVGAGNSAMAHAYVLSKLGHKVTILKTSHAMHDDNFREITKNGGIYGNDETKDQPEIEFMPIYKITRNDNEAFTEAKLVFVLTQSLQHKEIAKRISPYIQNIQALIIVPGNLGSIYFRSLLPKKVLVAEGESTIIDARIEKPGVVNIIFKNVRNALSFNPSSDTKQGFKFISGIIPNYTHTRTNVIETALQNPNLVLHTVGTILSASRIEYSNGEFYMYREAFTPSIWKVFNTLDDEKNRVIEAYGGKPQSYLDCCKFRNEQDLTVDSMEVFKNYAFNGSPKGPNSINNRYVTEDVPNGLCLLSELGRIASVSTPTADLLIDLASIMLSTDFRTKGRCLEQLGYTDKAELQKAIV